MEATTPLLPPSVTTIRYRSSTLRSRDDQTRAVQLGCEHRPILAIQAAYCTGNTVVGVVIAARVATPGILVIATASMNMAMAQFADTLLQLTDYQHLPVVRFVADTALREGAPVTTVDLHNILRGLLTNFPDAFGPRDEERLRAYAHGRRLIERLLFNSVDTVNLTDEEREEFRIAEDENSEATEYAAGLMMRVRFPAILCITTSSLLESTRPGGLFYELLASCKIIIGDEASQIPEPAFATMIVSRFPAARHIYTGDAHQLAPHLRCPASSQPARLGARDVMDILLDRDVPLAPLVTTFRAHPSLNSLPNRLVFNGTLVSGTRASDRAFLVRRITLPNPRIPSVLVNVSGSSRLSAS
nr:regulator of nonsense transcripts 1-like [Haemonchus contortus]